MTLDDLGIIVSRHGLGPAGEKNRDDHRAPRLATRASNRVTHPSSPTRLERLAFQKDMDIQAADQSQSTMAWIRSALSHIFWRGKTTTTRSGYSNSNFIARPIDDRSLVVYSASGSARPFVITNLALEVFDDIFTKKMSYQDLSIASVDRSKNPNDVDKILSFFAAEGLIEGSSPPHSMRPPVRREPPPRQLAFWVHVTERCNLRCEYCYVAKHSQTLSSEISDLFIDGLVRTCSSGNTVSLKFAGGEPTLFFDQVLYLASLAKARLEPAGIQVKLSMISNGTLITPRVAKQLKVNGFGVSISLDGLGTYNSARVTATGKPAVPAVLKGIETLLDNGIKPHIITVVSNCNLDGLAEMVQFSIDRRLSCSLSLSRDLDREGKLILNLADATDRLVSLFTWIAHLPNRNFPKIKFNNLAFDGRYRKICGAGRNYLALRPDGTLSLCPMRVSQPLTVPGQLSQGPNIVFDRFQYRPLPVECTECLWRWTCCGGCEALMDNLRGWNASAKMPFCTLYERVLPYWLAIRGRALQIRRDV
jgi:uncharacterized protein